MNRTRGKLALAPRYTVARSPVDARREVAPEVSVDEPRIRMPGERDVDDGAWLTWPQVAAILGLVALLLGTLARFFASNA